jgi:hypothetical protein
MTVSKVIMYEYEEDGVTLLSRILTGFELGNHFTLKDWLIQDAKEEFKEDHPVLYEQVGSHLSAEVTFHETKWGTYKVVLSFKEEL